jgi:small conductance mechanosensitive channel
MILEPPTFLRVDALAEIGVELKVLGVTKPIKQWEVMGEYRRRVLAAFAEAGVEIPHPARVMVSKAPPPGPPV